MGARSVNVGDDADFVPDAVNWNGPCCTALGQLRLMCGKPSYNDLSRIAPQLRRSTIGDVLAGRSKPSLVFVNQFVRACTEWANRHQIAISAENANELRWIELWRREQEPSVAVAPTPSTAIRIPRQLPGRPGGMVARSTELALLEELTSNTEDAGEPVLVTGMGGAGKSALVLTWAHRQRDRFQDGDLWLDLQGFSRHTPVSPLTALSSLLRTLEVPAAEMSDDVDHMSALFRSAIAGRRMLLILDNAHSFDQVRSLLPGSSGCTTVITSRLRLRALGVQNGARRITLSPLSPGHGAELLQEAARRSHLPPLDQAQAEHLSQLCGGLPLALRVVAEQLQFEPVDRISSALQEEQRCRSVLSDTEADSDLSVETVLSWSFQHLRPETFRVLRLMTYHPQAQLSLPSAAALCDLPTETVRKHLQALIGAHLLEVVATDRYRIHDLVRHSAVHECVNGWGSPNGPDSHQAQDDDPGTDHDQDARDAQERLLRWYYASATQALGLVLPHLDLVGPLILNTKYPADVTGIRDAAKAWLDQELDTLLACADLAHSVGNPSMTAWLTIRIVQYAGQALPYAASLRLLEQAHDLVEPAGDLEALCFLWNCRGVVLGESGRLTEARYCFQNAADLELLLGRQDLASESLSNVALTWLGDGDPETAIRVFTEALALAVEAGAQRAKLGAQAGMADALQRQGNYEAAAEQATTAAAAAHACAEDRMEAWALRTLADSVWALGQHHKAIQVAEQALALEEKSHNKSGMLTALVTLETMTRGCGQPERADAYQKHATELRNFLEGHP